MQTEEQQITEVIQEYFLASHKGDLSRLQQVFHPQARISGTIKNDYYDWSLNDFLQRISTAQGSDKKFDKNILGIDRIGIAAMVKARVVIDALIFTDYLSLLKVDGRWLIRNKNFMEGKS